MPKKTRYKKILASYRNKLKQEQLPLISQTTTLKTVQEPEPITILEDSSANTIVHYFKKDFSKSIFLIVGIITLELIFYFVSMSNNLRTVFKFIP